MHKISKALDAFSELTGNICSWFVAIMVLVTCVVVIMRYGLDMGSVLLQDVVLYLHGGLFLLGSAFALKRGAHVRVDIFYRDSSNSYKSNVNFILSLFFLLPVCFVIGFYSLELIEMSWKIREVSTEAGGLGYVYIQKTLIILFPLTMILTFAYQLIHKKWK